MKTIQLISEIQLMRVKLSNRFGGNSNMFQKTNIVTYHLAITQSFPIFRYEVGADKMAGQRINDSNLYFLHQICGQHCYMFGPTLDIFSYG